MVFEPPRRPISSLMGHTESFLRIFREFSERDERTSGTTHDVLGEQPEVRVGPDCSAPALRPTQKSLLRRSFNHDETSSSFCALSSHLCGGAPSSEGGR